MTLTLPTDLVTEIKEKAAVLGVSVDAAVRVFLKDGLQRQAEREAEISKALSDAQTPGSPDNLGALIFG